MVMSRDYVRNKNLMKFYVHQTKLLVSDASGDAIYVNAFDKVFEDLYGVSHFSKKIRDAYDDKQVMSTLNKVGIDRLLRLFKNGRFCNIIRDLVLLEYDLDKIRKKSKKNQRRGIRDRQLIKEYNYLFRLYKKGLKALRRKLGIKSTKTYKSKYDNLKKFANDGYDREASSWGGYDDLYYFDDEDRDEDDDFDDDDELTRFMQMVEGGSKRGRSSHKRHDEIEFEDYDDDEDRDKDDDFDDDIIGEDVRLRNLERAIHDLSANVTVVNDHVNLLLAQGEYDKVNHRDLNTHERILSPKYVENAVDITDAMSRTQKQIASLSSQIRDLASVMVEFSDWRSNLEAAITDDEEFDDESFAERNMSTSVIDDEQQQEIDDIINKYPDVLSEISEDKEPGTMKIGELIDEINSSQPVSIDGDAVKEPAPTTTINANRPGAHTP